MMKSLWRSIFGYIDENPDETSDEAVERAKRLLKEQNYEDACRILRYGEKHQHAEAVYLLGCCHWEGKGVREDAARALMLWKRAAAMGHKDAAQRLKDPRYSSI